MKILDTRQRSSIYEKLVEPLGEEDASALVDAFPTGDDDQLVTREFLRAELGELRTELYKAIYKAILTALPLGMALAGGIAKFAG